MKTKKGTFWYKIIRAADEFLYGGELHRVAVFVK